MTTTDRIIASSRSYLSAGNVGAYARLMSSAIRSALSDKSAKAIRAAIAEDKQEAAFKNLSTDCPTAQ